MKHYLTQTNEIMAIEEGQEFLIQSDWKELTKEELESKLAPTEEQLKEQKIAEAKAYLANTDYKMLPNYVPKANEDLDAIIVKRNETREFIRNNNA